MTHALGLSHASKAKKSSVRKLSGTDGRSRVRAFLRHDGVSMGRFKMQRTHLAKSTSTC